MACVAKEQAKKELPGIHIEVMDSQNVTASEGFIVLAAARASASGKDFADVIKAAEEVRDKVTFLALLDTIKHVYRTGRIPKIASQVGSMLNIKPLLTISDGLIRFKGMVQNRARGITRLIEILRDRVGQDLVHIAVMHAFAPEEAEILKERISSEFNCAELWVTEFSPVMGYCTGSGVLGLAFYTED
jgi:DegV family protein with EDD domain